MSELIAFADIEGALCDWLPGALAEHGRTVPVSTRVPTTRPATFIRLMLTGGRPGTSLVLDQPTITLEVWAGRESEAVGLMQLVRALIRSLPDAESVGGVVVYKVTEFAGPSNLPDPESNQTRYTYSVALLVRGAAL